ncbi:hypothetical protein G6F46_015369 [Rhizopus delemar]|nr:hypothetical protein G6F46_015369 [Rhizopus delemar]
MGRNEQHHPARAHNADPSPRSPRATGSRSPPCGTAGHPGTAAGTGLRSDHHRSGGSACRGSEEDRVPPCQQPRGTGGVGGA